MDESEDSHRITNQIRLSNSATPIYSDKLRVVRCQSIEQSYLFFCSAYHKPSFHKVVYIIP